MIFLPPFPPFPWCCDYKCAPPNTDKLCSFFKNQNIIIKNGCAVKELPKMSFENDDHLIKY
jgi:hypothetical protein